MFGDNEADPLQLSRGHLECRQGITDYGKMGARRRKLKYHPSNPWNFLILIQISINLKFQLIRTQKVRSWRAVVSRLLFCILRKTGNGILIPYELETPRYFPTSWTSLQWRRGPTPVMLGSSSLLSRSDGQRTRVREVNGAEQPPVLAASAGLQPGAGVRAELALPRGRVHSFPVLDKVAAYFQMSEPS